MAVAGVRGTGDWATEERPKDFRTSILWRNPNGSTPIHALMGKIGKEVTTDQEFHWWDEPNDITRLTVNGAVSASGTTIVVDSSDPSSSAPGSPYGVATHLAPGDILMVEPSADAVSFTPEYIRVTGVQSATTFTAVRGVSGSTAATIANDSNLLRIGSSFPEGSQAAESTSRNPIKYDNYCQIWKTAYEITNSARQTATRTGDPLKNDKARKMFDHSTKIELSLLFGRKSSGTGDNGQPLYTMDGIRRFIPTANTTVFSATPTTDTLLTAIYPVFDFDTVAGDTRIGFCGNKALNALQRIVRTDSSTTMELGSTIKIYGMNFREFIMPQGRLLLRTHPLLNRHALYSDSMFILDFSAFRWRFLRGRDGVFKDNIQLPGEDTMKGQWLTEGGLEVRYGGLTLGYLGALSTVA